MDAATIANCLSALAVFLVLIQLRLTSHSERQQFEDSFANQYRELLKDLPLDALLGESRQLTREELAAFYRYFDLSNQQAFMYEKKRIRHEVWAEWCAGIRDNLALPMFAVAWESFKQARPDTFDELRRLEAGKFKAARHG